MDVTGNASPARAGSSLTPGTSRKVLSLLETSLGSRSESSQPSGSMSTSSGTIGLVLAGHHPLILFGLAQVFRVERHCCILPTCTDADSTLEPVQHHQPHIVILDVDLPRNGAFTVLRRIRRDRLSTRVVLLATASDDNQIVDG